MRALFLHSDYIKVKPKVPALKVRDEPNELDVRENVLVVFVTLESNDTTQTVQDLVKEIKEIMQKVKADKVVLYPYAHLSPNLAKPEKAKELLNEAYELLKKEGIEVYKAPFGWYKEFEIKVKGHPLAELSRKIGKFDINELISILKKEGIDYELKEEKDYLVLKIKKQREKKEEKRFNKLHLIVYPNGKEYIVLGEKDNKFKVIELSKALKHIKDLDEYIYGNPSFPEIEIEYLDKSSFSYDFVRLVEKEALGKPFEEVKENPIREALNKFGFEWEPLSDYGHMRYRPYAALMVDLVTDYSIQIANNLKFPVFVIKGTNMFDLETGPVAEHAKLFGERMYELETDKSRFVLRYAACFQQFALAKDLILSYKHIPFGMLEVADSYRFEQPGEIVLGFRLRKFWMPDLHVFTKDIKEGEEYFYYMHSKIMEEIRKIGRDYELLINIGSPKFYNEYKHIVFNLAKDINKPVLVYVYPPDEGRYWIINIEYHITDLLGRPREIGTTQIDIGNGKRFNITYVDKNGKEKHVIILHNAILGSVERYIYALIDTALRKEKPVLPLWFSPIQVRVIPVSEKHLEKAKEIALEFDKEGIRVELDDRDETVNRKIMDAEKLWVPYIIVIGDKEIEKGVLSVRDRYQNKIREMQLEELIKEIKEKVKGYLQRPRYWPMELSKNPMI